MNEEEKKAIKYYQNKEVSLSVDFDTEKLLKALGITEEDSFENHQIRFKTLLNLIEKLQKENEELENDNKYLREREAYLEKRREDTINLFQNQQTATTIPIQKAKDKIEKYKNMCISNVKGYENYFKDDYNEFVFRRLEQLEKELLESEE